jgi:hypothetical protein
MPLRFATANCQLARSEQANRKSAIDNWQCNHLSCSPPPSVFESLHKQALPVVTASMPDRDAAWEFSVAGRCKALRSTRC